MSRAPTASHPMLTLLSGPGPCAKRTRTQAAGGEAAHSQPCTQQASPEGGRPAKLQTRGLTCCGSNTRRLPPRWLRCPAGAAVQLPTQTAELEAPAQPASPELVSCGLGRRGTGLHMAPPLPDSSLGCFRATAPLGASLLPPAQPLQRPKASKGHRAAPPASDPASVKAAGVHLPHPSSLGVPPGDPVTWATAVPPLG